MGEAGNREDAAPYNYPHFDDHIARGGDVTDEAAFRDSPWAGQRAEDFTLLRLNDGPRPGLPGYARTHEQTWSKPGPGTAVSGPSRTGIMPGQAAAPAPRPGPGPSHPPAAPRIHSALPGAFADQRSRPGRAAASIRPSGRCPLVPGVSQVTVFAGPRARASARSRSGRGQAAEGVFDAAVERGVGVDHGPQVRDRYLRVHGERERA